MTSPHLFYGPENKDIFGLVSRSVLELCHLNITEGWVDLTTKDVLPT